MTTIGFGRLKVIGDLEQKSVPVERRELEPLFGFGFGFLAVPKVYRNFWARDRIQATAVTYAEAAATPDP